MKRLCIYLVFDRENIIDQYVIFMAQELRTCSSNILVVYNSTYVEKGREELERYVDKVICRDNMGYDAGGFKQALCDYIGWEKLEEYDELILINDSIFGPFRPMKNIFSEMDNRDVDFWGLATHGENGVDISKHIQTYFLVIRSKMLHSSCFRKYWEDMPFYATFSDVVYQHEVKFTSYFESLGYAYDVMADTEVNDSQMTPVNNYMQYAMISFELIQKRNFPFLKKQQIAYNTLSLQTQENLYQAISYIDHETDYDVNLIWDNIIRTLNIADLQRSLHLQYIIFPKKREFIVKKSVAIVIFVQYKEALEYVLEYLSKLSGGLNYDIQIVSNNYEILEGYRAHKLNGFKVIYKDNWDWEELCRYDYVCVLHDADLTSNEKPSCTGKSYFYLVWENLIKNKDHLWGILEKFEKDVRLGFLAPPQPIFADYFGDLDCEWDQKHEIIERIVKRQAFHCPISEEKPPFVITNHFWIRGRILSCIKEIKKEEYVFLPYLWSYFAQHMGYYSGIVESNDYASMNEVNMQYYLKRIATQVKRGYGYFHNFTEVEENISKGALKIFCDQYPHIFIYGTGYYAKRYIDFIRDVEACIVSDGQDKKDLFEGIPVIYLSELKDVETCGVVLCLSKKNQKQVIPLLKRQGVENYFSIFS